jgi:hypothetical protein
MYVTSGAFDYYYRPHKSEQKPKVEKFEVGETITGSTSDATATIDSYRANPVQNMQQLLEYANTDNTTTVFLDEMFNMFMESIPKTLASGVSKRDLIKNIKDLYASKGTSEAHKLFLRLLFDEEAEIVYPNKFMLRASKGNWSQPTTMRVGAVSGSDATDIVGQTITGSDSVVCGGFNNKVMAEIDCLREHLDTTPNRSKSRSSNGLGNYGCANREDRHQQVHCLRNILDGNGLAPGTQP